MLRLILRLHPALGHRGQVALTLRTLGRLSTSRSAHAFLCVADHVARLVRAKARSASARSRTNCLHRRAVRAARGRDCGCVPVFNECYASTFARRLVRHELCEQALRLDSCSWSVAGDPSRIDACADALHYSRAKPGRCGRRARLLEHHSPKRVGSGPIVRAPAFADRRFAVPAAGCLPTRCRPRSRPSMRRRAPGGRRPVAQIVALYGVLARVNRLRVSSSPRGGVGDVERASSSGSRW